jgi:hypothetical protein
MRPSYSKTCVFVAAALVCAPLLACTAPPTHGPRVLVLKTVHPPAGQCGHQPAAAALESDAE